MQITLHKTLNGPQGVFTLNVDLRVEEGELLVLTGASGAGKTMLLRCVAGLEKPDSGVIRYRDESWYDSAHGICLPIQQRHAGFMFQDYALFPNLTVRGNIEFAQRKGASRKRVDELLEMMALGDLQHSKPATLSGGQKQRAALARALASEPRLLLLDEPLSALDRETRLRLQDEILNMHRQFGLTTLLVSHDISEIYKLSRRVVILESGLIAREGAPADVFGAGRDGGKFRFAGEVLAIEQADVVFAISILVGNQIVRIIATPDEAAQLKVGSRIMLLSKAFNPMLQVV
ncbi:MAG: ATP-binding cassette domain-containing protein [Methylobacillus sp.]|jgi:molybdate transport system ATP-binding protein|nr:ATP-binding cassette domain-containing protein [Methylobacillus sp.]